MMRERLAEAIELREAGRAKQDLAILDEARTLLLELVAAYPDDAEITFQTAVAHDNSGLGPRAGRIDISFNLISSWAVQGTASPDGGLVSRPTGMR